MSDNFYRAFEERYYAPRSVIKELRKQYLPFIEPLTTLYLGSKTYDAGCGRGEWLELMLENGFDPIGIDLDEGMLSACQENNLPGKKGDAVDHIATLENESVTVVTAFHVVEHISFEALRNFVEHSLRILKPGGLLIMETPNPENIRVATKNFYLDPTHRTPIPSELLSFVAEHAGFERVKVLRLQESKELASNNEPTLSDVISGASPDYAVVAQKKASAEVMEKFNEAFSKEYGLSLATLAERYHKTVTLKIEQVEIKVKEAEIKAQQAESSVYQFSQQIQAIYSSRSWKITAPIRWIALQLRLLKQRGVKNRVWALAKKTLRRIIVFINARPAVKQRLLMIAQKIGLRDRLKYLSYAVLNSPAISSMVSSEQVPTNVVHLTPRGREIYHDLKAAIEKNKELQ